MSSDQRRVLKVLGLCRTSALGGHVTVCTGCGHQHVHYNSCRNRHCPSCNGSARAKWLEREAELLLPVEYYHVVFTLPAEIGSVALQNPAQVYELLFQAVRNTLLEVAANPKHLGAEVGILAVLHTWGQNLHHHPHVHTIVTGGGLSCNPEGVVDESPHWVSCRPGFFLPVRILSQVFRGKFLELLNQAYQAGSLSFFGSLSHLSDHEKFSKWLASFYKKNWVVYSKAPWGGPELVLKYLARYTHGVAISNQRLLSMENEEVKFTWKDYAHGGKQRVMCISASDFLGRFLQHVLPRGFVKIRHYGLLANRKQKDRLLLCRRLLGVVLIVAAGVKILSLGKVETCPICGGESWTLLKTLPRGQGECEPVAVLLEDHDSS